MTDVAKLAIRPDSRANTGARQRAAGASGRELRYTPGSVTTVDERAHDSESAETPATSSPYPLYWASELDRFPPAEWIIDGAIPRFGIVGIIAPKGAYKTFVALDIACHIATGLTFHGRTVRPGIVVYVFAEGPFGAKSRIDAWCAHYAALSKMPLNRGELKLLLLPRRVPVNHCAEVAKLVAEIRQKLGADRPVAIVVDTLNANLDGGEDDEGMGAFAAGCMQLRDSFGATIIVVHHTPLATDDRGRGHTAFDGAIDTRLIIARDDERVTVECTHQRNGPDGWSVHYEAVPTGDSLALKPSSPTGGELRGKRRDLLELVSERGSSTYSALCKTWQSSGGKLGTFKKTLCWLGDNDYVSKNAAKYSITEKGSVGLRIPRIPEGSRG